MPKSINKRKKTQNKRKPLIFTASLGEKGTSNTKNITRRKKPVPLIIELSSSSSSSNKSTSGTTPQMVFEEKEKIDTFSPSKLEDISKTDLKISQELNIQ
jgi:hypothetical protein